MTDKEGMSFEKACFILRHGSSEGEHKYFEAITIIENEINRQRAKIEALQMDNKQLETDNFNANMNCEQLQAEIDGLTAGQERFTDLGKMYSEIRVEAVKEFAERLCEGRVSNDPVVIAVKVELEMVGETNEGSFNKH